MKTWSRSRTSLEDGLQEKRTLRLLGRKAIQGDCTSTILDVLRAPNAVRKVLMIRSRSDQGVAQLALGRKVIALAEMTS